MLMSWSGPVRSQVEDVVIVEDAKVCQQPDGTQPWKNGSFLWLMSFN